MNPYYYFLFCPQDIATFIKPQKEKHLIFRPFRSPSGPFGKNTCQAEPPLHSLRSKERVRRICTLSRYTAGVPSSFHFETAHIRFASLARFFRFGGLRSGSSRGRQIRRAIAFAAGSVVRFAPQPSSLTRTQFAPPPHLSRPPAASFRPPPAGARQPVQ